MNYKQLSEALKNKPNDFVEEADKAKQNELIIANTYEANRYFKSYPENENYNFITGIEFSGGKIELSTKYGDTWTYEELTEDIEDNDFIYHLDYVMNSFLGK